MAYIIQRYYIFPTKLSLPACFFYIYNSDVKRSSQQCRLADGTKEYWLIGMFRTMERVQFFCAICQAALPGKPFDT